MDTTSFTGNIAKLVELPNDLIMNGIKYDKQKRLQQSIRAYDLNQGNDLIVDKMSLFNIVTNYEKVNSNSLILADNLNDSIYFVIHNTNSHAQLYKINEKERKNLVKRINVDGSQNYEKAEFLGQNDNFIFISLSQYYSGNQNILYLIVFNKDSFTLSNKYTLSTGMNVKCLNVNNSGIEVLYFADNGTIIHKKLKQENNGTLISTDVTLNVNFLNPRSYIYQIAFSEIDDENKEIFIPYLPNNKSEQITLLGINYETNKTQEYVIDSQEYGMKYINSEINYYFSELLKRNKKRYIILGRVIRPSLRTTSYSIYGEYVIFHLFEIKNNGELILLDIYNNENNIPYLSFLYDEKLESFVVSNDSILKMVKINDDLKFEEVFIYTNPIKNYGFTKEKALMIQNKDLSIEEIVVGNGSSLKIELEKDTYNYEGTTIETNFKTGITDLLGNYIDNTVEYKISGSATFSDGSKVKKIKLSKDGMTTVPIIVTGVSKVCVTGNILI